MVHTPPRAISSVDYMGSGYPSWVQNRQPMVGQLDGTQFRLFSSDGPHWVRHPSWCACPSWASPPLTLAWRSRLQWSHHKFLQELSQYKIHCKWLVHKKWRHYLRNRNWPWGRLIHAQGRLFCIKDLKFGFKLTMLLVYQMKFVKQWFLMRVSEWQSWTGFFNFFRFSF